jgi:hypothetical protein
MPKYFVIYALVALTATWAAWNWRKMDLADKIVVSASVIVMCGLIAILAFEG